MFDSPKGVREGALFVLPFHDESSGLDLSGVDWVFLSQLKSGRAFEVVIHIKNDTQFSPEVALLIYRFYRGNYDNN